MSSFEWNKIIASVLTAMIVAMVAGILASSIVRPHHLEKAAYLPPGAEGEAGPSARAATPGGAAGGAEPARTVLGQGGPRQGGQGAKGSPAWPPFREAGRHK